MKKELTFAMVPKCSREQTFLWIIGPGQTSARPKVLQNRSSMTNLEVKPHILPACFRPTLFIFSAKKGSDSRETTSTAGVSENGWTLSRPFPIFYQRSFDLLQPEIARQLTSSSAHPSLPSSPIVPNNGPSMSSILGMLEWKGMSLR